MSLLTGLLTTPPAAAPTPPTAGGGKLAAGTERDADSPRGFAKALDQARSRSEPETAAETDTTRPEPAQAAEETPTPRDEAVAPPATEPVLSRPTPWVRGFELSNGPRGAPEAGDLASADAPGLDKATLVSRLGLPGAGTPAHPGHPVGILPGPAGQVPGGPPRGLTPGPELEPGVGPRALPAEAAGDPRTPSFAATWAAAGLPPAEATGPARAGELAQALPLPSAPAAIAGSTAAAAAAPEQTLASPPGSPGFAGELAARVTTLVRDGVEQARLQLNPAEMGPVEVRIRLEGDTARVVLVADQAQTRQWLDQAMPTLAGSLREAGLTLSGGGVFEQAPGRDGGQGPAPRGQGATADRAPDSETPRALPAETVRRRGVVDLVA